MKKILFALISLTSPASYIVGQVYYTDFDNINTINLDIDSVANPNNVWEIAHPSKDTFTVAYSGLNAIITDKSNPYPTNDTSSFVITHVAGQRLEYFSILDIAGWYYVNADTLTDLGYIEFSQDFGATWYYADSIHGYSSFGGNEVIPTFTGNSNGWRFFHYGLHSPAPCIMGDTVLIRFTFMSDSVQTNKDGLMFDDLMLEDWIEGVQETDLNICNLFVTPNPATTQITVETPTEKLSDAKIVLYDLVGCEVLSVPVSGEQTTFSVEDSPAGMYFLTVYEKGIAIKTEKVIITRE